MATSTSTTTVPAYNSRVRLLGILVIVAGAIMIAAGVFTWFNVRGHLIDEKITVSEDAERLGGDEVDGPFSAYAEADVIQKHALEATDGLTYAELPRDSELRQTAATASFLRASLFTSVVSFGVAAMAVGLGIVLIVIGWALLTLGKAPVAVVQPVVPAEAEPAESSA